MTLEEARRIAEEKGFSAAEAEEHIIEGLLEGFYRPAVRGEKDVCPYCRYDNGEVPEGELIGWDARGPDRQGWDCFGCGGN